MRNINSSGVLAASSAAAVTPADGTNNPFGGANLWGFTITPAAADTTLTIYDNNAGAASGTVLASYLVKASTSAANVLFNHGIGAQKGISYALVGSSATCVIYWSAGN